MRAALGSAAVAVLGGALTGDASRRDPGPSGVLRFATGEPTAFYAASTASSPPNSKRRILA
jgi:hypothetical protein